MDEISLLALTIGPLVKLGVDLVRVIVPHSRPYSALVALGLSVLVAVLAVVAFGQPLTAQTVARGILAGLMAAGTAVLLTEAHRTARKAQ